MAETAVRVRCGPKSLERAQRFHFTMNQRPSSNPASRESAEYAIGGMRIRLTGAPTHSLCAQQSRLAAFRAESDAQCDLLLNVHIGQSHPFGGDTRTLYRAPPHWSILQTGTHTVYQVNYARSIPTPTCGRAMVLIDWPRGVGDAYLPDLNESRVCGDEVAAALLGYPLGEILLITHLADTGGLLLHACGVECDGKRYAFLGNSGHGKSTLARLCENRAQVLNDDRVVARSRGERFWVYGTPWHGDHPAVSAAGGSLHGLFVLYRDRTLHNVPFDIGLSTRLIMQRCFPPFWSASGMRMALALCSQLAAALPCRPVAFSRTDDIRDLLACAG